MTTIMTTQEAEKRLNQTEDQLSYLNMKLLREKDHLDELQGESDHPGTTGLVASEADLAAQEKVIEDIKAEIRHHEKNRNRLSRELGYAHNC